MDSAIQHQTDQNLSGSLGRGEEEEIERSSIGLDAGPNQSKPELMNSGDKDSRCGISGSDGVSLRLRSASRDSSVNDDPKSLVDSISATSGRQNWSGREMIEDDPSISSIKGDSVSATIADYNRKHRALTSDNQSRTSARLAVENESLSSPRIDDMSSNINFYGGSSSGITAATMDGGGCETTKDTNNARNSDFASISSNVATSSACPFDIIEESSNVSIVDDMSNQTGPSNKQQAKEAHRYRHRHLTKQFRQRLGHRAACSQSNQFSLEIDDLPIEASTYQMEPIIIRGNGNLTLFGLSNSFSSEFPSALIGKVSKEEFDKTMRRINSLLNDQQSLSAKLLLFGGLCCCCSLGFSLVWPSIVLRKRSKTSIEKFLSNENNRLYSKLGLNWKLAEQRCYSNHAFVEYVLMIEFTPKMNLYLPD